MMQHTQLGAVGSRHGRGVPAAVVEHEGHVERQVDGDAEHVELDGGAEAGGEVEVDEVAQQRAALLVPRHVDLELEEHQHVGAHLEVRQRVRRARVPPLLLPAHDDGRRGQQQGRREEERREFGSHRSVSHSLGTGGSSRSSAWSTALVGMNLGEYVKYL